MDKFRPLSPDPFIIQGEDMTLARFGHINAMIEAMNAVIPSTTGIMYQSQYDPGNTGIVTNSFLLGGFAASYFLDRTNHVGLQSQATITGLVGDLALKGDMFKSIYDPDNDGRVSDSEALEGFPGSFYLNRTNHTGSQAQSTITGLVADLALKENKSEKGVALGYCDLDAAGKVPNTRLNLTALNYKNSWNATTNVPALADGIGVAGDTYIVGVGGTIDLGSGNITFNPGDFVIYNGLIWEKVVANPPGVTDVNGYTGSVTLDADDIAETATRYYIDSNENDALAASFFPPTAANPLVTEQEITNLNLVISTKGDMFKVTYDANNNGIVDNSERLSGQLAAFYLARANHTGTQPQSTVTNLITDLSLKENKSEKGVANGYCDLDSSGKVPIARLNISALNYQNSWNVATNNPVLADGIGTAGDTYIVGVGGTRNLGSGAITFAVGDLAVYNGTVWQKITASVPGVTDWNGLTGAVNATTANLPESTNRNYVTDAQNDALDNANAPSAGNPFVTQTDLTPLTTDITTLQGDVTTINTTLTGKENKSEKGVALGYPPLDAGGKIPNSYLNFSALNYQNSWDAFTNTPPLADGIGSAGEAYIVGTAGSQDLGSGLIVFGVGDLVVYNGTIWQKITGVPSGVSSVNGFTGAVTLTADNIAETATRYYVNSNQNAALDAAISASGANRFATMSDLSALGTVYYVTPDEFANGHTIGDGVTRTLASLGYTNPSAAATWTLVAADPRFTINVATMTIDWISIQTAILTMEQTRRTVFFSPGGTRTYNVNQTIQYPRTNAISNARFVLDWGHAITQNISGSNIVVHDRFPSNQVTADAWTAFPIFIYNLTVGGNGDNTNTSNIGIRIASNIKGRYENIVSANSAVNMVLYFNLCIDIVNCQFVGHGLYGLIETNANFGVAWGPPGQQGWNGGTNINSQCNKIHSIGNRFLPGNTGTPIAAHYIYGGYGHIVEDTQVENMNTTLQHMLYYEGSGDQVENPLVVKNFDYEINGQITRAGIRVRCPKGKVAISSVHGFALGGMDATIECDNQTGLGPITMILRDTWQGAAHVLRDVCNSGGACFQYGAMWDIAEFGTANPLDIFDAANWDTGVANAQIPYYQKIRYNGVFVDANQQQSTDTWDYPRITTVYDTGTPTSNGLIPQFIGQMYYDSTSRVMYYGKGTALTTDWVSLTKTGAGTPVATATVPDFIGQMYYDSVNLKGYIANGIATSANWTILN